MMLVDALQRCLRDSAAAFALLVDAKHDQAVSFYQRYGFRPVKGKPMTLFMPVATAQKTLV